MEFKITPTFFGLVDVTRTPESLSPTCIVPVLRDHTSSHQSLFGITGSHWIHQTGCVSSTLKKRKEVLELEEHILQLLFFGLRWSHHGCSLESRCRLACSQSTTLRSRETHLTFWKVLGNELNIMKKRRGEKKRAKIHKHLVATSQTSPEWLTLGPIISLPKRCTISSDNEILPPLTSPPLCHLAMKITRVTGNLILCRIHLLASTSSCSYLLGLISLFFPPPTVTHIDTGKLPLSFLPTFPWCNS